MENTPFHEASKRRKRRRDREKWRMATLNINGITKAQRAQHLKRELREKRIDAAVFQGTLCLGVVDPLRDYCVVNSGSVGVARKRKWGTPTALQKAVTPRVEEIAGEKCVLTGVEIGKIAIFPWGPSLSCHPISA